MEEQILKIISKNNVLSTPFSGKEMAAKEISQLVHTRYMKFIEWLLTDVNFEQVDHAWYWRLNYEDECLTLEEIFTYWQDDIEKQSATYTTPTEKCNTKECPYIKAQSENLKNMTGKY
jgi:hypothetical protein